MNKIEEIDMMVCRSCGNPERASEGYPCQDCGTFLCIICNNRGVVRCQACQNKVDLGPSTAASQPNP